MRRRYVPIAYLVGIVLPLAGSAFAHHTLSDTELMVGEPWPCPGLTHTQISWQPSQREVCGGQAAAAVHAGVQG